MFWENSGQSWSMNGYLHVSEIISVLQIGEWRQKTKTRLYVNVAVESVGWICSQFKCIEVSGLILSINLVSEFAEWVFISLSHYRMALGNIMRPSDQELAISLKLLISLSECNSALLVNLLGLPPAPTSSKSSKCQHLYQLLSSSRNWKCLYGCTAEHKQ